MAGKGGCKPTPSFVRKISQKRYFGVILGPQTRLPLSAPNGGQKLSREATSP